MDNNLPVRVTGEVVPSMRIIDDATPFVNAGFYKSPMGIVASYPLDSVEGRARAARILNRPFEKLSKFTHGVFHVASITCEEGEFEDKEDGELRSTVRVMLELETGELLQFYGWTGRKCLTRIIWVYPPPWKAPLVLHFEIDRSDGEKVRYRFWTEDGEVFKHQPDPDDTPKKRK